MPAPSNKFGKWRYLLIGLPALLLLYFLGPQPEVPHLSDKLPKAPQQLAVLEKEISQAEAALPLRPNNEARIVWQDSLKRTALVLLYLHGFSASQMEGHPTHRRVAEHLGANLYLARLAGHGYRQNNLEDFSAEAAWEDAKTALARALQLGDEVIIMGTSTGCTFGLTLAAYFPDKVRALINLSPNIRVANPAAPLLTAPWGAQLGRLVEGERRRIVPDTNLYARYWDTLYTMNAVVELQNLLENTMVPNTFERIHCPVLSLYYYRNAKAHDQIVDLERIEWMHEQLGTPDSLHYTKALPGPGNHVIGSPIQSKDIESVHRSIHHFCQKTLGLLKN